jgi:Tol biopolymer transport system component
MLRLCLRAGLVGVVALCVALLIARAVGGVARNPQVAYRAFSADARVAQIRLYDLWTGLDVMLVDDASFYIGTQYPSFAWSPDGAQIAYAAWQDARWGPPYLTVFDVATGARRILAQGDVPSWSPDGAQIVYQAVDFSNNRINLHVVDVASGDGRQLVQRERSSYFGAWSPDGQWIAFVGEYSRFYEYVYVIAAQGDSAPLQLTSNTHGQLLPAWSSDSAQIAFASTHEGNSAIYTVSPALGAPLTLALAAEGNLTMPTWSADGRLAAMYYQVSMTATQPQPSAAVVVGQSAGDGANDALQVWAACGLMPSWRADGRWLAVACLPPNLPNATTIGHDIYITDGQHTRALTTGPLHEDFPQWRP